MKIFKMLLISAMVAMGCSSSIPELNYELVTYSGDLKVERFDSTVTDENRFNYNNKIYSVGSSFTYSYQYYDRTGSPQNFQFTEEDWEFVQPNDDTVNEIELRVLSGLKPMIDWIPDYDQTLISYQPSNKDNFEMTGLIENEANIWAHPPRDGLFRILQLSPYPSVSYPLEEGKEWMWSFQVGSHYGDERWETWDGNITITSNYEITGKQVMQSQRGELETWTIESEAVSELGSTFMEAVFNDSLGFLEMNFTNIDGSKFEFSLEQVSM